MYYCCLYKYTNTFHVFNLDCYQNKLVHNFIRCSSCIDLKRCLWDQAWPPSHTLLGDSTRWRRLINLPVAHPEHLFDSKDDKVLISYSFTLFLFFLLPLSLQSLSIIFNSFLSWLSHILFINYKVIFQSLLSYPLFSIIASSFYFSYPLY